MFTAQLYSAAPLASLTGPASNGSDGPSLIVIGAVVLGAVWLFSFLFARPTVVVVEQSNGLAGVLAILVIAGIFVLFVLGASSGVT